MIKRSLTGLAVAAALVAAPSAAVAGGTLYLYADSDYRGLIGTRNATGFWNISRDNNDALSSVRNQTTWSAAFWEHASAKGHCWSYSPGENDPSFWWYDNDTASSFALGRGC